LWYSARAGQFISDHSVDKIRPILAATGTHEFARLRQHFGLGLENKFRSAWTLDFHALSGFGI
jgi:hypothetical protein